MRALTPKTLHPPFARYAHGVEIPADWRIIQTSGQLGVDAAGDVPEDAYGQAMLCFGAITEILKEGRMSPRDVAHIWAYVTDRAHMAGYMRARDAFVGDSDRLPSSTLIIVSGFTREEFMVEIEVLAAAP